MCDKVREIGFALHKSLGPGLREKLYEQGICHRLMKAGIQLVSQPQIEVLDEDHTLLATDQLDLVVEDVLVIQWKAAEQIHDIHIAQLLGYLKATLLRHGLLMNFGAAKFQIKKYVF